jgi:hypothetical protein
LSGLELPFFRGGLLLFVPEPALVARPGTQVPGLDQKTLCGIDITLGPELLDADLHAILGEDDILGLDLIVGGCGNLLHRDIEVVAKGSDSKEDNEQED